MDTKRCYHLTASQVALTLLFSVAACIGISDASAVVDVYRMIQYDLRGVPYGSRRSSLNQLASSGYSTSVNADLTRAVVIMPMKDINATLLNDILQKKVLVAGLLLLLPRESGGGGEKEGEGDADDDGSQSVWGAELEQLLIHDNLGFPVYFAEENDALLALFHELLENERAGRPATAVTGGHRLITSVAEPKKIATPLLVNIQGWLPGSRSEGEGAMLPTIAVVASYDSFSVAPGLATKSGGNGSGVVALLELARLFARLYSNPQTHGRYNLLFVLTSGGPFNYDGTRQWLDSLDTRVLESLELAVCLNSIGRADSGLFLHVSKPPKDAAIQELGRAFQQVADKLSVPLSLVHKKINISNPRVAWEHEQFSRQRVLGVTISSLASAPGVFENTGSIGSNRRAEGKAVPSVVKTVKLVAETLAQHIYDYNTTDDVEVFADGSSLSVSTPFISHWLGLLAEGPSVAPFLPKDAPLITNLKQTLSDFLKEVSARAVPLGPFENGRPTFVFYDVTTTTLSIFQVPSITFDLYVALAVGAYLTALFVILHIATKGLDDFMGVFKRPMPKKNKAY